MPINKIILPLLCCTLIFNTISAQDLVYKFCNQDEDATVSLDLEVIQEDVANQYPDIFYPDESVYITARYGGILKVVNLSTQPSVETVCSGIQGFDRYYEIAIDSNEDIFISSRSDTSPTSTQLFKINDNCNYIPIFNNYPEEIQAMSFDKDDNLYVGYSFDAPTVCRADAGNYNYFYPWHNFGQGSPSGDFVEKDGYLYIAWNINDSNYLYKVTLNSDNQYVSHVNLGAIRNQTFGLANEYGILYGVTPNSLYRIDLPTLNTTTVIGNQGEPWWGAAGLHEAITIDYNFFETYDNAENQIDELTSPYTVSSIGTHYIYVRITNETTGAFEIFPIEIIIISPPEIMLPEPEIFCVSSGISQTLDTGLNGDDYHFTWYLNDQLIPGSNSPSIQISESGVYKVVVNPIGFQCSSEAFTTVETSDIEITNVEITDNTTAEVFAQGDNPPFEFQIDDGEWQVSPIFNDLLIGTHQFRARNSLGCLSEWEIVNLSNSNVITPNGDGINDVFKVPYINDYQNSEIRIFDKYGKIIFTKKLQGGDFWDGKYEGRSIPTDTYWYEIIQDGKVVINGYILVKNY